MYHAAQDSTSDVLLRHIQPQHVTRDPSPRHPVAALVQLAGASLGYLDLDRAAKSSLNESAAMIADGPPYVVPEPGGFAAFSPVFPRSSSAPA
jgi:hypothetical protein